VPSYHGILALGEYPIADIAIEYLGHGSVSKSSVQGQGHGSKKAQVCAVLGNELLSVLLLYIICYYFGLLSADEAICVRQDRFRNRYSAFENGICCVLSKY